jgi:O-antigen ligase
MGDVGYLLFILVNAALFIRPGEIVPDLEQWPIYQYLILACLAFSWREVLGQLTWKALRCQPITFCVVGLWVAVVLSHLIRLDLFDARETGSAFGKVVIYYLLLVGLVTSPGRLRQFLVWLVGFIVIAAVLAVLQYHDYIELPGLSTVLERRYDPDVDDWVIIPRLCSTGIFNDPNDLCLILTVGILLCLYHWGDQRRPTLRWVWLAPVVLFGYTLILTQSRGGLLGLLLGLLVLFRARYGWWKALSLGILMVPVVFLLAGGRQTSIDLNDQEDTAQARIQLWAEGVDLFKTAPVFGIGAGRYAEEVGLVAHNSFVHAFTELGFFGGTLFVSSFALALWELTRLSLGWTKAPTIDPEVKRFGPFLIAIVAGYGMVLLSISRGYVVPTYLILGMVAIYLRLSATAPVGNLQLDKRLVAWMAAVGASSLVVIYVWVRVFVNWG